MTIKEDIKDIKKHISVLNDELGSCEEKIGLIENTLTAVKTNQKWLMKGWWGLIIPITIQIIITILNLPKP